MNPIATLLSEELEKRRRRNRNYSLRAFARSLGLEPSVVSKIIRGKRIPGAKTYQKIKDSLGFEEDEQVELWSWVLNAKGINADFETVDNVNNGIEFDVWHFIIFEALKIKVFSDSIERLRKSLCLEKDFFQLILDDLVQVKLVDLDSKAGSAAVLDHDGLDALGFSNRASRERLKESYFSMSCEKAFEGKREGVNLTLALPISEIDSFMKLMLKAKRKIQSEARKKKYDSDSVFNFSFMFYPVLKK